MHVMRSKLMDALSQDLPYAEPTGRRVQKSAAKPAAVLILLGDVERDPSILYTRRTETVETHKGQMAFPGGMCEDEELAAGDFDRTALRETEEEVGIHPEVVEVVGRLPSLMTITDFSIVPIVGMLRQPIAQTTLKFSENEIAEAIWIPVRELKTAYRLEQFPVGGARYPIHVYPIGPYRIWGATGSMTKNLLDRLQALG